MLMGLQYVFCCANVLATDIRVMKTQLALISFFNNEMESQEEANALFSRRKKATSGALFAAVEKKRWRRLLGMDSRIELIIILIQRNQTNRGSTTFG